MAEERAERRPTGVAGRAVEIDTSVAHPARVYDYWLGGSNNFPADREAAERVLAATPGLESRVRANRAFLARAVRYLAAEAGIRQFLDIGTGIPAANNTHEVARAVAPDARVSTPQTLRTRDEVTRFFEGLDLVPPGVVYVHAWRPDPGDAPPEGGVSAYGGVARKA